jgi:hypothetical protein
MRIPFSAYASDCTVTAEVDLETDRLSDFLAMTEGFEVDHAAFQALDDGRVVEADGPTILLDDLCIIAATGPRGLPERRLWTRQYPARARLGPYTVYGYLHAAPTIDPFKNADRRTVLAFSSSVVEYDFCGESKRVETETVLLNRAKIETLDPVTAAEFGPSSRPELKTEVDPRSKDLTGDVFA